MKISLLINMKMPSIFGIFITISRENFMLGSEDCTASGPGYLQTRKTVYDLLFVRSNVTILNPATSRFAFIIQTTKF